MNKIKNTAASVAVVALTFAAADTFGIVGYAVTLLTTAAVLAVTSKAVEVRQ